MPLIKTLAISSSLMLSLVGCMNSSTEQSENGTDVKEVKMQILSQEEPISEPNLQGPTLVFGVKSFGCTKVSDFRIEAKAEGGRCLVEIVREIPDRCKQAPSIRTMRMDWAAPDDCAGLPIEFSNPLLQ